MYIYTYVHTLIPYYIQWKVKAIWPFRLYPLFTIILSHCTWFRVCRYRMSYVQRIAEQTN
jgi:hypothetical protein